MAVDLMSFAKMEDQMAVQEAASQGLKSMEHLIRLMSHQSNHVDCTDLTDLTVSKFKKVISLLNRTGHARFRRGPVQSFSPSLSSAPTGYASRPQNLNQAPTHVAAPATVQQAPAVHTVAAPQVPIAAPASFVQSQPQSLTSTSQNRAYSARMVRTQSLSSQKKALACHRAHLSCPRL